MHQPPLYTIGQENLVFIVTMLDDLVHTDEHPLCSDPTCPCHDDSNVVREYVTKPLDNGLLTNCEAMRLFWGKQIIGSQDTPITDEEVEQVMNEPSPLEADIEENDHRTFFDGLDLGDLEDHPF
jgi:hypothetical protein